MGDYYRYIAEFTDGDAKSKAAESARAAYADAQAVAEKDLAVTHPIRLGLALNYSVFMYEVLSNPDEACKMARTAFGRHRRAGQRGGGLIQGLHADHAASPGQLDTLDFGPGGRRAVRARLSGALMERSESSSSAQQWRQRQQRAATAASAAVAAVTWIATQREW